ncbi:MAG: hypothetical protein HQK54_01770 [Oligoflexales bacterium]|nr:hypothetical protein [Oligoflexales bacterium]
MAFKNVNLLLCLFLFFDCCTTTDSPKKITKISESSEKKSASTKPPGQLKVKEPLKKTAVCIPFNSPAIHIPYYVSNQSIVITRVSGHCLTNSGREGYEKDSSSLMAMGFPCSGGGVVDVKGQHYDRPNVLTFPLTNSCQMAPSASTTNVGLIAKKAIGLDPESKFLAYYPFVTQYWELVDYPDTGIGDSLVLLSKESKQKGWKILRENGVIKVRLYGRENGWIKGKRFYHVEAAVRLTARKSFKLEIANAKALGEEEVAKVKQRCEQVTPPLNCNEVFASAEGQQQESQDEEEDQ